MSLHLFGPAHSIERMRNLVRKADRVLDRAVDRLHRFMDLGIWERFPAWLIAMPVLLVALAVMAVRRDASVRAGGRASGNDPTFGQRRLPLQGSQNHPVRSEPVGRQNP